MAPRVHNSGHWTIEGALTSQFENHIRAICGLPLGATDLRRAARRDAQSGRRRGRRTGATSSPTRPPTSTSTARAKPRPGRKMGHVTRLLGRDSCEQLSPGSSAVLSRRSRRRIAAGGRRSAGCGVITSIGRPSCSSCGRTRAASPTTTQTKLSGSMYAPRGRVERRRGHAAIAVGDRLPIIVGPAVERVGAQRAEHRARRLELAGQLADIAEDDAVQLLGGHAACAPRKPRIMLRSPRRSNRRCGRPGPAPG